jgi:geranylgeranyl pyrophosphate synthase
MSVAKPQIDERLVTILAQQQEAAKQLDPVYGDLLQQISLLVGRGGKRLRPILALLAYEGFGGKNHKAMLDLAVAQELFHAFILMHDDIIDRDFERWRGPNIAGVYFEKFSKSMPSRDALHFAEAWALMAGDLCLNLSQQVLLGSGFEPDLLIKASNLMHKTLFEMVGGEVLDVAMSLQDLELSEARLLKIARYKTAAYSFRLPLQTGALLAGANDKTLKKLEAFAFDLGIAFQLQNDLNGMFGSSLSDLREGKRTLLIMHGLKLASKPDQKTLLASLGNPNVTIKDLKTIQKILTTCGAKQQTEATAQAYRDKALEVLPRLGLNAKTAELLGNELAQKFA